MANDAESHKEIFERLKIQASELPHAPGVYIMHDKNDVIIYVGKAKSLKNRVSQYFANLASHSLKTKRMVEQIYRFETIFASSEFDALLLENTMIKKHMPKYNILLKDDKGYPFVRLGTEPFARLSVSALRKNDGARYFGPYGGRGSANTAIQIAVETFKLPTCGKVFPRDIGKERPCLRLHMKKCCGVCTGQIGEEQYSAVMKQVSMMLDGSSDALEKELQARMESCAESEDFESAALFRDRLKTVQKIGRSRVITGVTMSEMDVLAYACIDGRACIALLCYLKGSLCDKKLTFFDGLDENDAGDAIESFITQFYGRGAYAPRELYISHPIENQEQLEQYLSQMRSTKCNIAVPQKGEKQKLVALALENAVFELNARAIAEEKSTKTLEMLGKMLDLPAPPMRIEAIDISNTGGSDAVGSLTVFENGKPLKSKYKRFKIKEALGGDDYGSMAEVLGRRLDRALNGDESFLPLPDVFLMDGGLGQVRIAAKELDDRGIKTPVFGMVKDDKHRTRGLIAKDGKEIGLAATPPVFALTGRIQEETHRFAVDYHHKLHNTKSKHSALDNIAGVGESRKKLLLRHFGSITAIKAAGFEELCKIVPKNAALAIVNYFNSEENQ